MGIIPFQCLGLGGYKYRLLALFLLPLGLTLLTPLASLILVLLEKRGQAGAGLRRQMPFAPLTLIMYILYFTYPIVSQMAFGAFDCEEFEDSQVRCSPCDLALTRVHTARAHAPARGCSYAPCHMHARA